MELWIRKSFISIRGEINSGVLRLEALTLLLIFVSLAQLPAPLESADRVLLVRVDTEITMATEKMLEDALAIAGTMDARLIIVAANTPGGEINAVKKIMDLFESSRIPICFFVHPIGASAWSGGTYLLMASHIAAMASGTSIGSCQPVQYTGELINNTKYINALSTLMANHAALHGRNETAAKLFVTRNLNLGPEEALRYHVIEIVADDVNSLLKRLSEMALIRMTSEAGTSVWRLVPRDEVGHYNYLEVYTFEDITESEVIDYTPGLRIALLQVLFNPMVSMLMLTFGFLFLLFGLQSPGYGSEIIGLLLLILALMSLQVIGIEPTIALLFTLGFALTVAELKTHIGLLGVAGAFCIILGSFLLFPSPQWLLAPEISMRIRNTLLGVSIAAFGAFAFLIYKVAQTQRMRVKTGFEALEGCRGVAVTPLKPYGEVRVEGEFWRARAEEGEIEEGSEIIVVGREGLLLIVRPFKSSGD